MIKVKFCIIYGAINSITIVRQILHNSNDLTKYSKNALVWSNFSIFLCAFYVCIYAFPFELFFQAIESRENKHKKCRYSICISCHGKACVFQQLQINIASRIEKKNYNRKTAHLNKNTDNKTMRNEQVKIKRIDASTTFCNYNVQLSCKLQSETEKKMALSEK